MNNPAVKKWLPFDLICAVDLEYILIFNIAPKIHGTYNSSNIVLYFPCIQLIKNPTVKKWLPFHLNCAVDLEYIVPSNSAHLECIVTPTVISGSNLVFHKKAFTDHICSVHQYMHMCRFFIIHCNHRAHLE